MEDVEWATTQCQNQSRSGNSDFDRAADDFFRTNGLQNATTWQEALNQFFMLKNQFIGFLKKDMETTFTDD